MLKRLFVGNLPYEVTDSQLEQLFSEAGKVESAKVITDRYTGRGKGFGFVEMSTEEEAQKAVQLLSGRDLSGRAIVVNEARPQEDRDNRQARGGRSDRPGRRY